MSKSRIPQDVASAFLCVQQAEADLHRAQAAVKETRDTAKRLRKEYDELMGLAVEGVRQGNVFDKDDPTLCPDCEGCCKDATGNPCETCGEKGHI